MLDTNALFGQQLQSETSELVSLEDAYAFILLLDAGVATDRLNNVENCTIFYSFDELRACVAGASPRIQSKPVIILSSHAAPRRNHLVEAVALHWQHGGKYVLSRAKCRYLSKTGKLQVEPVPRSEMHRLALLPSILSMPVREALLPHSQLLLFVPSGEFTVCVPEMPLLKEEISHLEGLYRSGLQTPAELERLARSGALNHSVLRRLPIRTHWPLTHHITARLADCEQLNRNLESRDFSKSMVEATISLIERSEDDLLYMRDKLSEFLLALSRHADILLSLRVSTLESYIALARQSSRADDIGINLSLVADRLCELDSRLITPTFELLVSSLSSEALNSAYCFAAAHVVDAEVHCIRLAQSMRRFGHETSLGLLLASLRRAAPSWLQKRSVLRSFEPLLASPLLPALASQVGEKTISDIRGWMKITDRFQAAVNAGDRSLALQILRSQNELAHVDIPHWLNSLRGFSNELREMALPVADMNIPGIHQDLPLQRLVAIRFSDGELLKAMRASGALTDRSELNGAALSIAGDNTMLNEIIFEKFAKTPLIPIEVQGKTACEVFRNAAIFTRNSDKIGGPLISVIMTAYNPDVKLMKIALDSITSQTWRNIEIIIVDDASYAHWGSAISKLAANYNNVKLIRSNVNSGPYIGRNLALQQAKGEFIAIQDSDDWSHPQRLATQVGLFLRTPEAHAVTTEHIRINQAGHVALESKFRIFGDGPMTSMFRAKLFQQVGSFAAIRSRGDLEMRERVAAYYGCQANSALPLPLMLCYAHSGTLSHSTFAQKAEHIQLFHDNISRLPAMTSLFRDNLALTAAHQTPIPRALRAPRNGCC